jgi:predicted transcriptional regulator
MASRPETIKKALKARQLKSSGKSDDNIAKAIGVSPKRVEEYLEANSHGSRCRGCGGQGVNKQRSTGKKKPLCDI